VLEIPTVAARPHARPTTVEPLSLGRARFHQRGANTESRFRYRDVMKAAERTIADTSGNRRPHSRGDFHTLLQGEERALSVRWRSGASRRHALTMEPRRETVPTDRYYRLFPVGRPRRGLNATSLSNRTSADGCVSALRSCASFLVRSLLSSAVCWPRSRRHNHAAGRAGRLFGVTARRCRRPAPSDDRLRVRGGPAETSLCRKKPDAWAFQHEYRPRLGRSSSQSSSAHSSRRQCSTWR